MEYNAFDLGLLNLLHKEYTSELWQDFMRLMSSEWYFIILAAIIFSAFYKDSKKMYWKRFILLLIAAGMTDAIAAHILKPWIGRLRPCQVLEEVRVLAGCAGLYSFPSNHAANSMCVAAFLWFSNFKKLGAWSIFGACVVGLSRVVLGVHYPTDILAGFALGAFISFLVVRFSRERLSQT